MSSNRNGMPFFRILEENTQSTGNDVDISFNNGLEVFGDVILNNNVTIYETLKVLDDVSLNKNVTIHERMDVLGFRVF